ncbi:DM13 domain-containing protein [Thalassotalea sp. M1531]|uniref:DM13 domain-containing protein n=1 Tax=Thalassotalea algicola TaxID=2716224 RepID=A0A7Y0LH24_9GAMM|nr:DM13 domain-containing protein [Thalassotalea algicola]NMP33571.1 DM13 domain-containing protein [Thalassotalea algicola]
MNKVLYLVLAFTLTLTACGGGSGSKSTTVNEQPTEPPVFTGVFVDAAVSGLSFETNTQSGFTNELGEFTFQQGEAIRFSIGDIEFPQIVAAELITPLEIFTSQDVADIRVINMIRLLQSLDADGEPSNGIEIPAQAHDLAQGLMVDFSSDNLEAEVNEYLLDVALVHQSLIPAEQASFHFRQTLESIGYDLASGCESTHAKVGYSGDFQTIAHNVSGTARIIDDCTIEITNFSYDGQGPVVYFYGSLNQEFSGEDAYAMGSALHGTVYENANLLIKLPEGKTLNDINSLSVWCVEFSADFGNLTFSP